MRVLAEKIKEKIDIVALIGTYVSLKKSGRNFIGNCPFHQEKSPSFVVSPERKLWHCFGSCHEGGDVISFVRKYEHIGFVEALKILSEQAGIAFELEGQDDGEWKHKERLYVLNQRAADYYHYILTHASVAATARDYLQKRTLNERIIATFQLGYAPDSWDSLMKYLFLKGFTFAEMADAGLIVRKDKQQSGYDRFRGRIMFPIKDSHGSIIGFSGRILQSDNNGAKYVNTPETEIYRKRESLYGLHIAKDAIRKENNVLLVEGEFDMIVPFQQGVENVVAIKGSAITKEQLGILRRLTSRLTFALDADAAGEDAIKRGLTNAEPFEFEMYVAQFTAGKDPDESVRADSILFKKQLKQAVPIYDFLINTVVHRHPGDEAFQKNAIAQETLPFISSIQNPIVQGHYVKKIAHILDINEENVMKMMRRVKRTRTSGYKKPESVEQEPWDVMAQQSLLGTVLISENPPALASKVQNILDNKDYTIPSIQKVIDILVKQKGTVFTLDVFLNSLPAELQEMANRTYMYMSVKPDIDIDHVANVERMSLRLKGERIKRELAVLIARDDEESRKLYRTLENQRKDIEKRLQTL